MASNSSAAADTLLSTRARLRASVLTDPVEPAEAPTAAPFPKSVVHSVTEGVRQWWRKNTLGRAVTVVGPLAEPYLRPVARRHYQVLLLGSAAAGALVSHYPVRSIRTVLRLAGPLLISSVIFEISKAGLRQMRIEPRQKKSSD